MTRFYKNIRRIITPIAHMMFRIKCVGKENIPSEGAFVLCSNHTSMLDIVLLIVLCPRAICFIAKKELFKNRLLGKIFRKMGAFPVDRGNNDLSAIRHACGIVKEGKVLGIFPEGTRYRDCKPPREVKPGVAFVTVKTGADVIPVSIYKEKGTHPLRRVTVRFGEPIKAEELCEGKLSKEKIPLVCDKLLSAITKLWELKF
ncbi:MAG: 1-acyl-sn-glycerol-3-phosphate acyltransferase [Clostridia bacterium]|nr:1-acyl-sn-glycerol-3-phosphate acyltransferase [Clostridia bacterium]MBR3593856.1 1-acyl-sn-glycerol-3-phosphate acyltransferase [Clostridia bacterium]